MSPRTAQVDKAAVVARWQLGDGSQLTIDVNLGTEPVRAELPRIEPIRGEARAFLPPHSTIAWIES